MFHQLKKQFNIYELILDYHCIKVLEYPSVTKVVPVLLHVLDLQLVAALSKDGFGVLLEAPRQKASLPRPCVYPAIHIDHN